MSLWSEVRFSLRRHRLKFLLYFITYFLSGLTVVFSIYLLNLGTLLRNEFLRQFELEIFLSPSITPTDYDAIFTQLKSRVPPGTKFRYISQEEARKIFINEFGDDLIQLLGSNPLPPSILLTLPSNSCNPTFMRNLQQFANELSGVEEAVYEGELASIFEIRYQQIQKYLFSFGVFFLVVMFILSFLTIRSTILDSKDTARIFILLGAKPSFFLKPYFILSILFGFFSFMLAGSVWLLINFVSMKIGIGYLLAFPIYLLLLPIAGGILGFIICFISSFGIRNIQKYRF